MSKEDAPERVWLVGFDPYVPGRCHMSALDHGDEHVSYVRERPTQRATELSNLISTRLLGVSPDSQDVVLEDDDWNMIIEALIRVSRGPT